MSDSLESSPREADRWIFVGLLGLAVASVLQMVEKGAPDLPQQVSIHAFAIAIPLLAVGVITDYARRAGSVVPRWFVIFGVIGSLFSIVGFGSLFFQIGLVAGLLFSAGSLLGLIIVRRL